MQNQRVRVLRGTHIPTVTLNQSSTLIPEIEIGKCRTIHFLGKNWAFCEENSLQDKGAIMCRQMCLRVCEACLQPGDRRFENLPCNKVKLRNVSLTVHHELTIH